MKTLIQSELEIVRNLSESEKNYYFKLKRLVLLRIMGFRKKEPPLFIENAIEKVLNPYLVYRFTSELGFPKEMIFEELNNNGIEFNWSDWCEFWLWNFQKIPHTDNYFN